MSQSGKLVFFREEQLLEPITALRDLLACSGATNSDSAYRTLTAETGWERFQNNLDNPDVPQEQVGVGSRLLDLPSLYMPGRCLLVCVGPCSLARTVHESIATGIDVSVRGRFCPGELWIAMGFHDLYEYAEHEDGFLIARAFVSIRFWGYSSPSDWDTFREEAFQLPAVRAVKSRLESITGPLSECAFWNV